jgi:hypothetical protein
MKPERKKLKFGDRWENSCAGEDNPHRVGFFVETIHCNGKVNGGKHHRFTDKMGGFWLIASKDFDEIECAKREQ